MPLAATSRGISDCPQCRRPRDVLSPLRQQALSAIGDCPIPTVALIHGACIRGGLEIAGQCDLRIAADGARFGARSIVSVSRCTPGRWPACNWPARRWCWKSCLKAAFFPPPGHCRRAAVPHRRRCLLDDEVAAAARRIADGAPLVARWHKQWVAACSAAPLTTGELRDSFAFLASETTGKARCLPRKAQTRVQGPLTSGRIPFSTGRLTCRKQYRSPRPAAHSLGDVLATTFADPAPAHPPAAAGCAESLGGEVSTRIRAARLAETYLGR